MIELDKFPCFLSHIMAWHANLHVLTFLLICLFPIFLHKLINLD